MTNPDDIEWFNTPAESDTPKPLTVDQKLAFMANDEDVLRDEELEGLE